MTEEQKAEADEIWKDYSESLKKEQEEHQKLLDSYKEKLKGLINLESLFEFMNEMEGWAPVGIVEVELTDEKKSGYPKTQCARVKGELELYLKSCPDEHYEGLDYYFVNQKTGYICDDYYGHLLFPLNNGKFIKLSYNC